MYQVISGRSTAIRPIMRLFPPAVVRILCPGAACSWSSGSRARRGIAWQSRKRRKYLYHNREAGAKAAHRLARPAMTTGFRRQADCDRDRGRIPYVGSALAMGLVAGLAVVVTLDGPGLTIDEPLDVRPGRTYIRTIREEGLRFFERKVVYRVFRDNAEHPPLGRWLLGTASTLGEPFEVNWKGPDPTGQYVLAARLAPAVCFGILVGVVVALAGRRWGLPAGAAAGYALAVMPRVFAHAHLAALDTFLSLFWTVALLSGERAIGSSRPSARHGAGGCALVAGALDQDPRLVAAADSLRLGVSSPAGAAGHGGHGDLGTRRNQPVLARLALDLVRLAGAVQGVLGYWRRQADPVCPVLRRGLCRPSCSLALPLVLFRGDRAAGPAASGMPGDRSGL